MRYFLDTEFNEDGRTIDLISIGIVAEDGREFYACNQEAELHRVNPWVREHVLPKLPPYDGHLAKDPEKYMTRLWKPRAEIARNLILFTRDPGTALGATSPFVAGDLVHKPSWLPTRTDGTPVEFWAYYADYDWVVLCQLFGTMMDLPRQFPKWCRDLKQLSVDVGSPTHPPDPEEEHHALVDARWNRDLYKFLMARRTVANAIDNAMSGRSPK